MGFLGKLAFWKKKDNLDDISRDLGLDKDLGLDMGPGPSPDLGMGLDQGPQAQQQPYQRYPSMQQPTGFQSYPGHPQGYQQPYPGEDMMASKNMEVISSKLDALRVSLDSINQRLANIEAIARGEQEDTRRRRYY